MTQFNDRLAHGARRSTADDFLVGIALADGNFSSAERSAIFRLSDLLRLPRRDVKLISMVTAQYISTAATGNPQGAGDTSRGASDWKRLMRRWV